MAKLSFPLLLVAFQLQSFLCWGQAPVAAPDTGYQLVTAGNYKAKNNFYKWLWGAHYRDVWTTPVQARYLDMDTTAGGLKPVRKGGANQTRTLHLKGANGQDYVFRSINKYYGQALPVEFHGTFIETLIADQASTAHPYAAFTIPPMIAAAGIYHTTPMLVVVPDDPALDSFRTTFGNMLVLFEARPDGDMRNVSDFGNSEDVISTSKMLENITADHNHQVDQLAYVKARIFDMFIGDWGRHEDQWRWASFKQGDRVIYKPIPRDRDQTYTLFDGALLQLALGAANLKHLQSFDHSIKDVAKYNFPARHLDRRLANQPSKQDWLRLAREIQHAMTDSIIRYAVSQMPAEAFRISGEKIISKLISRRNALEQFAETYYNFLAAEVEIVGSDQREYFKIDSAGANNVIVNVLNTSDAKNPILYTREFNPAETKEVRLFGLAGIDQFHLKPSGIKFRVIGGEDNDVIHSAYKKTGKTIDVYDTDVSFSNNRTDLKHFTTPGIDLHQENDTLKNKYRYNWFSYDKTGPRIKPGTTVGIGYGWRKQKWGVEPFASDQSIMFEWTFTRGGLALVYRGQFNQVIGKWGLAPIARYDFPYVDHFFGIGNNTERLSADTKNKFYRVHTTEILGGLGINRNIDSHFVQVQPYYQSVEVDVQPGKFLDLFEGGVPLKERGKKTFGGIDLTYRFLTRNDALVPSKGLGFAAGANYARNFTDSNSDSTRQMLRYSGALWGYIPLSSSLTLAMRVGGATIDGQPVFYQLNTLGGNINLRGYVRRRFFGNSSGYSNNELRWLVNTKNRLFTGKIGLLAFYDIGRVWQPGETSDNWHSGYGGGLVIVPFRKAVLNGTVGVGEDKKAVIHARIGFLF
jgi:hypothetical protein